MKADCPRCLRRVSLNFDEETKKAVCPHCGNETSRAEIQVKKDINEQEEDPDTI